MAASYTTEKKTKFVEAYWDAVENGVPENTALVLAKAEAGYADTTPLGDILRSLDGEFLVQANIEIKKAMPKAIRRIKDVLEDPAATGATNALAAAASVLDRAGLVKKESKEVNITMPSGVAFMPAKVPVVLDDNPED